jgi:squalene-hopene/tetraprenyl-beta-curcumene cyclase
MRFKQNGKRLTLVIGLAVMWLTPCVSLAAPVENGAGVSIESGVDYLLDRGVWWNDEKGCVSCHRGAFMLWGLNEVDRAGGETVSVDELTVLSAWSLDWRHWMAPDANKGLSESEKRQKSIDANADAMGQLILSRGWRDRGVVPPMWVNRFVGDITRLQQNDGSWKPGGQLPLQDRPVREAAEVATMWVLLALADAKQPPGAVDASIEKAMAWLNGKGRTKDGVSTEWWVTRLLLENRVGGAVEINRLREQLLALQRDDGGWGWRHARASDAFGTGLALYALGQSGAPSAKAQDAVERARRFLAQTQIEAGGWRVPSTRLKDKGRIKETANYWGSAWAIIGLMQHR